MSQERRLADLPYVADPFRSRRQPTRVVRVGDIEIGGDNPIRIQSMTNTDTLDTDATVAQICALARAGCEIARVTAPSIRDAENLGPIVAKVRAEGLSIPLVADIHFTPNAAMIAAEHVEKVRINPGNYADKKKFEVREYDDAQYAAELERVAERFRPLVRRCKRNGVAMRIGTNHGSLSDRILNRYGDTPLGMVESALEFLDVCEDEGYFDLVFSMKASNTQVAIQAYRLLAARLAERAGKPPGEAVVYPFHVGVTEAGDAEDGRIKSAIGIGALLEDGLGDTIRVSLTEDPVKEVPVARLLAARAEARWRAEAECEAPVREGLVFVADPYAHARRTSATWRGRRLAIGGEEPVRVELDCGRVGRTAAEIEASAARLATGLSLLKEIACESLLVDAEVGGDLEALEGLTPALAELSVDLPLSVRSPLSALIALPEESLAAAATALAPERWVVGLESASVDPEPIRVVAARLAALGVTAEWQLSADRRALASALDAVLGASEGRAASLFSLDPEAAPQAVRTLVAELAARGVAAPIVLRHARSEGASVDAALVDVGAALGTLLCDGLGDAVSIAGFEDPGLAVDVAYRVLQGARLRTTRTEYISCPSCGRTLFDLEETTAKIKQKTAHLSGVKIAVMGCIVNGPGEMADADFGYVGSGVGKVSLYVGKQIVERAVPEAEAPDRLVALIREHGRWADTD